MRYRYHSITIDHGYVRCHCFTRFHRAPSPQISQDGVSAPILEALLLDVFQREFLELLGLIKARDFDETGLISLVSGTTEP